VVIINKDLGVPVACKQFKNRKITESVFNQIREKKMVYPTDDWITHYLEQMTNCCYVYLRGVMVKYRFIKIGIKITRTSSE